MKFAARFSTTTGVSSIHAATCPQAKKRRGFVVTTIEAKDAKAAAKKLDEDGELTDRGFPYPTICACTKGEPPRSKPPQSNEGPKALRNLLRF